MLPIDEAYERARSEAVKIERADALRLIRLTGPQRVWFLQNTITADVENVPDGSWVESCFLDPKGRIQAHFRAGFLGEEIWLDVEPDGGPELGEWFERYRFRTKVEIEPAPKRCVTVLGAGAEAFSRQGKLNALGPKHGWGFGYQLGNVGAADLHLDEPDSLNALAAMPVGDPGLYDVLRIEAGIGRFGVDYDTRTLPQEAGLTRVVSVEKGCYVGQETVARIHFRGHINKVLRPLLFHGEPKGRDLSWEGQPVGVVTSSARSPRKGHVGIGMVRVEPPEGAVLEVEGGGTAELGPVPEGTKVKTQDRA